MLNYFEYGFGDRRKSKLNRPDLFSIPGFSRLSRGDDSLSLAHIYPLELCTRLMHAKLFVRLQTLGKSRSIHTHIGVSM